MKKTTAIKQFRYISLCCPPFGQSAVPEGGGQHCCFRVHTGTVAAGSACWLGLLAHQGFAEHAVKTMLSGKL